jgi:transaldolase
MNKIDFLKVKIFSDGANIEDMLNMYNTGYVKGLTTNPTLMNKSGIKDYKSFCLEVLTFAREKPVSFEVFSDNFEEMYRQASEISSWAENVYVKIPITNTKKETCYETIQKLVSKNIKVNVTAIMTINQVVNISKVLSAAVPSYVSIFAGRIADTGRDPLPILKQSLEILRPLVFCEVIWASPREFLNIFQANDIGCHIITVTKDILKKVELIGYNLEEYSLDTVKMFYNDSVVAGYKL